MTLIDLAAVRHLLTTAERRTRTIRTYEDYLDRRLLPSARGPRQSATSAPSARRALLVHQDPPADSIVAYAVAQRIRYARGQRGWRQQDLARATGMARPNIARLELGRVMPTMRTLEKVGRALDVPLANLLQPPNLDASAAAEDRALAEAGLGEWADQLDREDR
jgi:transcriptional regulator with XRE-family HTH domain